MAQASQSLGYVCRSCRHALKTTPRATNASILGTSVRLFSNTSLRSKTLATFLPTTSPRLDALLEVWREEVFLPSVLPSHHQRLVFKRSKRDLLLTPPGVTATVQTSLPPSAPNATEAPEESIKLAPLSKRSRLKKSELLKDIEKVLSETSDVATWDNLIPFLEGMRLARENVYPAFIEKLARKANLQDEGRWTTILTAAAMVKRTNVRLSQEQLTTELILGAHDRAARSNFDSKEPAKIFESIARMLEQQEHCGQIAQGTSAKEEGHVDMRRHPIVIAARLSFASAKAVKDYKGKDEEGVVTSACEQILALNRTLRQVGGIVGETEDNCQSALTLPASASEEVKVRVLSTKVLEHLALMRCALTLASRVDLQRSLGKQKNIEVKSDINNLRDAVKVQYNKYADVVAKDSSEKQRRSLQMLDHVEGALKNMGAS